MEFRIADTFTDSLAKLTGEEQKAVKTAAFDLQLNPAHPGGSNSTGWKSQRIRISFQHPQPGHQRFDRYRRQVLHSHDTEELSHEEEKDGAHSVPCEH
jgi:hypothetical protein